MTMVASLCAPYSVPTISGTFTLPNFPHRALGFILDLLCGLPISLWRARASEAVGIEPTSFGDTLGVRFSSVFSMCFAPLLRRRHPLVRNPE